jgi:acetoin utilization deacetylase AcuC-like enzyme
MPKDHLLYLALQERGLAGNTFTPAYPDAATLCLVHEPAYVNAFLDGSIEPAAMRRIGLPWSQQLVRRTLIGTGSAVLAARLALSYGVAVMCNGGTVRGRGGTTPGAHAVQ